MKEPRAYRIIFWAGIPICILSAMLVQIYISMSSYILKTNPDLQVNAIFFSGTLNEIFPITLAFIPTCFYIMIVGWWALLRADKIDKEIIKERNKFRCNIYRNPKYFWTHCKLKIGHTGKHSFETN